MDDEAVRIADEIEKALTQRISAVYGEALLCLGAACTGCIGKSRQIAAHHFVAYAVSR